MVQILRIVNLCFNFVVVLFQFIERNNTKLGGKKNVARSKGLNQNI